MRVRIHKIIIFTSTILSKKKSRSVQQQMSRHNSRVGFEFSQELRLDNQLLVLRKYEGKKKDWANTIVHPSDSIQPSAQSEAAAAVCSHTPAAGHVIQLLPLISAFRIYRD